MHIVKRSLQVLGIALAATLLAFLAVVAYWGLRPNTAQVDPALGAEVWPAVRDGMHNSNTDLTYWQGAFYLVHARSRFHMGSSESRLIVLRSPDARTWTPLAELSGSGADVRDPKLVAIGDRLVLYVLKNSSFEPEPYVTAAATSTDGEHWTPFQELEPKGWLFWRPKTADGSMWYVTAYWHEHGKSILLRSRDGLAWEIVSTIYEGDRNDETDFEFLPDGRMLVTARLEGQRSWHQGARDACTLLAVAAPPYEAWERTKSSLTRLDGPALFSYNGRVYAVGRYDPDSLRSWLGTSSLLTKKRTALYLVEPERLVHLSDLPSAGDTSYAGVVLKDGQLYTSYYTNAIDRDYSWLLGLICPSDILMARIDLARIEALALRAAP